MDETCDADMVMLRVKAGRVRGVQYPELLPSKVGERLNVRLSATYLLSFPSLAEYDAWCEELDRQRAALGVQQTFGDAA